MRCTKCGTISFDHYRQCVKCGQDLSAIIAVLGQFYATLEGFDWFAEPLSPQKMEEDQVISEAELEELEAIDFSELNEEEYMEAVKEPEKENGLDPNALQELAEDELFKEALDKIAE